MILELLGKGLGIVQKVLGGREGIASAVATVSTAINGSPELKTKLQELELEEMKLAIESDANIRALFTAEIKSDDKWVRRARPAMLWLSGGIIGMNFIILPFVNAIIQAFGGDPLVFNFPVLPEEVYWLFGSIFSVYTGARTVDKIKKNGGK